MKQVIGRDPLATPDRHHTCYDPLGSLRAVLADHVALGSILIAVMDVRGSFRQ